MSTLEFMHSPTAVSHNYDNNDRVEKRRGSFFHNFFTLNLPFYIKTKSVTFVLTQVKMQYKKLFSFTKPTQGYLRKLCSIC